MQYFLMNKNNCIAEGTLEHGIEDTIHLDRIHGTLPLGMSDFTLWINNRKASKHNQHLKALMRECGCDTLEGFLAVTHAASVNDTFWVKAENDPAVWEDVSLYTNEFNDTISRLAFSGLGIADPGLSSTSPELVTGGSFPKCLRKEDGSIYLYKRGLNHSLNGGLEPYCEVLAGQIAEQICTHAVHYSLALLHGTIASRCRLFTNETVGFVPMANLGSNMTLSDMLSFMDRIGSGEEFREMLVLDAITFNQDRHPGNFGVLIDNDTMEIRSMAPVFDLNLALLPYVLDKEFDTIGDKLLEYGPKLGEDFTRLGQLAMTDQIRHKLLLLRDTSFRGDERFPKQRMDAIRELVQRQIDAVLSRTVLYTKDVFIPYKAKERENSLRNAREELDSLYPDIEAEADGLFLSVDTDDAVRLCIESSDPSDPILVLDFLHHTASAEQYGEEISVSDLPEQYQNILSVFEKDKEYER